MQWNIIRVITSILVANYMAKVVAAASQNKPNIILYLADDLGWGELNQQNQAYDFMLPDINPKPQRVIETTNILKFAQTGTTFKYAYAAAPVCNPSRWSIQTGIPVARSQIRDNGIEGNDVDVPTVTLAKSLKKQGYITGLIGKYGHGNPGTKGSPQHLGYDYFYGYGTHVDAHDYFPIYMWNNTVKQFFPNNYKSSMSRCLNTNKCTYAPNVFLDRAKSFIKQNAQNQFFLMWTSTTPHVGVYNYRDRKYTSPVQTFGKYKNLPSWPSDPRGDLRGHASMITNYADRDIGELEQLLSKLSLTQNTLIVITSDNGPETQYINGQSTSPLFFTPSGGLRGIKRDMFEGGLRVPTIVKWPGHVPANYTSTYPWTLADLLLTFNDISGVSQNALDNLLINEHGKAGRSVSVANIWLQGDKAASSINREWLSFEYCTDNSEASSTYAFINIATWPNNVMKLVQSRGFTKPQLYNLSADEKEENDLANNPQYQNLLKDMQITRKKNRVPLIH